MIFNVNTGYEKEAGSSSLSATSGTIYGKKNTTTFTVTRSGDGAISAKSSNTSIATVAVSGTTVTVTANGYGSATITVSVSEGTNHTAPSDKTYAVTVDYRYLYKNGTEYTDFTGTLINNRRAIDSETTGTIDLTITRNASSMKIDNPVSESSYTAVCGSVFWESAIDLTNFDTLTFSGTFSGTNAWRGVAVWSTLSGHVGNGRAAQIISVSNGVGTADISSLKGKYHIGFWVYEAAPYITMNYLRLS